MRAAWKGIVTWLLIGVVFAIATGNLTNDSLNTGSARLQALGSVVAWPLTAGGALCTALSLQCTFIWAPQGTAAASAQQGPAPPQPSPAAAALADAHGPSASAARNAGATRRARPRPRTTTSRVTAQSTAPSVRALGAA